MPDYEDISFKLVMASVERIEKKVDRIDELVTNMRVHSGILGAISGALMYGAVALAKWRLDK